MQILLTCLIAGLLAGFGTGLAGLSAAAVISPMLIVFLDFSPYQAVGIALASDVLASATSAWTYKRHNNIDVRNGLVMLASVLCFTLIGSYLGALVPLPTLGAFSMLMTLVVGLKFVFRPVAAAAPRFRERTRKQAAVQSLAAGAGVGLICGFVGAGGGMMMLLVLVGVLGYALKTAIGTSVFIMTFTALTGAVSHFAIDRQLPDPLVLILCIVFTLLGALGTARFANKARPDVLNRALGIGLTGMSAVMLLVELV